ncbi:hypothetical protein GOB57_10385 [Sinorhizobium meliloti]|nr:hypothetical protein [Sinorhizobium meliloti]
MLTDIRYPVRFGGQPTTTDRYKTVICSYPLSRDVPRIESGEARPVLSARATIDPGTGIPTVNRDILLVEHDGRLFRKVCGAGEADGRKSLEEAFESAHDRNRPHHPASLWEENPRPVGVGLWNRIAHRVYVDGNGREKEKIAWPNAPFSTGTAHWTRNSLHFEKWSRKLSHIAQEEFQRAVDEAEKEADRLLWIGDELWLETPPLVYEVGHYARSGDDNILYDHQDFRARMRNKSVAFCVQLAFLPDWLDHNLDRQYFPLSKKDEALSYAGEANSRLRKGSDAVFDVTGGIPGLDVEDDLLEFDHTAYSLSRTSMLLAGDLSVNIANRPDSSRGLTVAHHEAIDEATREIAALGWNPSSWAAAHLAGDMVEAWQRMGLPQGWSQFPSNRTNFANLVCERTMDLFDTVPVMIRTTGQGHTP